MIFPSRPGKAAWAAGRITSATEIPPATAMTASAMALARTDHDLVLGGTAIRPYARPREVSRPSIRPRLVAPALEALGPLSRPQRLQRLGEPRAVREGEPPVELEERLEHEAATRHLRVGERQPVGLELQVSEQQQVDVEGARAVSRAGQHAPPLHLDRLAEVEQLLGLEL